MAALPRVTLFTRPGCSLCEPVRFIIRKAQQRLPFAYSEVDISLPQHSTHLARYTDDIPVVHVNGREVARHRLTEPQLIAALQQHSTAP